jgi:hypothetical protein
MPAVMFTDFVGASPCNARQYGVIQHAWRFLLGVGPMRLAVSWSIWLSAVERKSSRASGSWAGFVVLVVRSGGRDPGSRAKVSSIVAGREGAMEGWRISFRILSGK